MNPMEEWRGELEDLQRTLGLTRILQRMEDRSMDQPSLEELEQDALLAPQVLVDMRAIYLGRVVGSTPEEAGMRELVAWFKKDPKTYLGEMLGLERAHQAKLVAWAKLRAPKAEPRKRTGKAGAPDEGSTRAEKTIEELLGEATEQESKEA